MTVLNSPAPGGELEVDIDPITFEVVRNKLAAITEEQAITLKSVSGSAIVVHATDFNNGTYLADGSIVTMGPQVLFHTGTMSTVIKSVIEDSSENPGIEEGDQFILNDPYRGAVHQPDVSVVAPVFYKGERIAWVGSCAHQIDIGGMVFGSWNSEATEIQQEGMLLPGIKLIEGRELREDLWQMIMGMTRLPQSVGLDLKAMVAANNVAEQRLLELMDRYGGEVVLSVMHSEIAATERRFRGRLASMPDVTVRSIDYIDGDGLENNLHQIAITLRKTGDRLEFDLSDTSPQAAGFINCAKAGMIGGLFTGLLPILAPDIRWNQGILRCVDVLAPEGILCNAERPAPTSGGTISAVWVSMNAAVMAVSRLAACFEGTATHSQAISKGSVPVVPVSGLDADGEPFGSMLLEGTAGGGGAGPGRDGIDPCGDFCVPRPGLSNVEDQEMEGPYRYLYRRQLRDTSGAGTARGGRGIGAAITPHGVDWVNALMVGHGVDVPNSTGAFGGFEGSCVEAMLLRAAGRDLDPATLSGPAGIAAIDGVEHLKSKPGPMKLEGGDVFAWSSEGGGGYGDPLDRDPDLVVADLLAGVISVDRAARDYGVVFDGDGEVDLAATDKERAGIRRERLGGEDPVAAAASLALADGEILMGPALKRGASGGVECCCGQDLGSASKNWKERAADRIVEPDRHGAHIVLHEELELREHSCPGCGTLLESELVRRGAPALHTIEFAG